MGTYAVAAGKSATDDSHGRLEIDHPCAAEARFNHRIPPEVSVKTTNTVNISFNEFDLHDAEERECSTSFSSSLPTGGLVSW